MRWSAWAAGSVATAWCGIAAVAALLLADTSPRDVGFYPHRIGLVHTATPKMGALYDCSFSPDGRRLAVAGEDGSVRLFQGTQSRVRRSVRLAVGRPHECRGVESRFP